MDIAACYVGSLGAKKNGIYPKQLVGIAIRHSAFWNVCPDLRRDIVKIHERSLPSLQPGNDLFKVPSDHVFARQARRDWMRFIFVDLNAEDVVILTNRLSNLPEDCLGLRGSWSHKHNRSLGQGNALYALGLPFGVERIIDGVVVEFDVVLLVLTLPPECVSLSGPGFEDI
jgi:hypothetical protein